MYDHIHRLTEPSRAALISMIEPKYVMIMLGHNVENGGVGTVQVHTQEITNMWENSFALAGRPPPVFIYVVPWLIAGDFSSAYIGVINNAFRIQANRRRNSKLVSLYHLYDRTIPDEFDSERYQLDSNGVHPGNIPTAVNISQDLYNLLFSQEPLP